MLVDLLASPEAKASFAQRQTDIRTTAEFYGVNKRTAVVIGGAALALQGLDSYVQIDAEYDAPFDVDVVRMPNTYQMLFGNLHKTSEDPETVAYGATEHALPFSIIAGSLMAKHFAISLLGYTNFREFLADRVLIGNLAVLPAQRVAMIKSQSSRPKDRAGLIKSHVLAVGAAHPIITNSVWRASVANSVIQIRRDQLEIPGIFARLAWLNELVETDFNHTAFFGLDT